MTDEQKSNLEAGNSITLSSGLTLGPEELQIQKKLLLGGGGDASASPDVFESVIGLDNNSVIRMDFTVDENLTQLGLLRELKSKIMKLRKSTGVTQSDPVAVWIEARENTPVRKALESHPTEMHKLLNNRPLLFAEQRQGHEVVLGVDSFEMDSEQVQITLTVDPVSLLDTGKTGDSEIDAMLQSFIHGFGTNPPEQAKVNISGKTYTLKHGVHYARRS
jgi:hypothetical protein